MFVVAIRYRILFNNDLFNRLGEDDWCVQALSFWKWFSSHIYSVFFFYSIDARGYIHDSNEIGWLSNHKTISLNEYLNKELKGFK